MIVSNYNAGQYIKLDSSAIKAIGSIVIGYSKIIVKATKVCTKASYNAIISFNNSLDNDATYNGTSILLLPSLFGFSKIEQGVYNIEITIYKTDSSTIIDKSCAFIDIDLRCKVAAYLKHLVEQMEITKANVVMFLHYSLSLGSNCNCLCEDLCTNYNELIKLIDNTNTDCGCN